VRSDGQHLGCHVLGQPMRQRIAVGMNHFAHARYLGRGLGRGASVVARHQHMHIAATGQRCGHGVEGCALDGRMVVFSNHERGHVNSSLA